MFQQSLIYHMLLLIKNRLFVSLNVSQLCLANTGGFAMRTNIFWIFGILQSLTLAVILFIIFNSLNLIHGDRIIGWDSQLLLSIMFPLFLLIEEYIIYSKE